jgi:ABC-2 type transport system ATP-binding protein
LDKGIFWLQGSNGSGKTTVLRMIAGLIPFEGDILFDGISLRHQPLVYRRHISLSEAEPSYPRFISGRELIAFYQDIRKGSLQEIDKMIDLFGMQPWLSTAIGAYSSGMIKKLSLLLAFLGNPSLILLDEPFAMLDEASISVLPVLMGKYQEDHGSSFIFSSHHAVPPDSFAIDKKIVISDQTMLCSA